MNLFFFFSLFRTCSCGKMTGSIFNEVFFMARFSFYKSNFDAFSTLAKMCFYVQLHIYMRKVSTQDFN